MLNTHITAPLQMRFRHPMLVEVAGDRRDMVGQSAELVDVYDCPHRGNTYTILHVPAGAMPLGVTAAEPAQPAEYDPHTVTTWSLADGWAVQWWDGDRWPDQRGQYAYISVDGEMYEVGQAEGLRYIAEALHQSGCPASCLSDDGECETGHWSGTRDAMAAHLGRPLVAPEIALLSLSRAHGPLGCRGADQLWSSVWPDGYTCGTWLEWLSMARRLADASGIRQVAE